MTVRNFKQIMQPVLFGETYNYETCTYEPSETPKYEGITLTDDGWGDSALSVTEDATDESKNNALTALAYAFFRAARNHDANEDANEYGRKRLAETLGSIGALMREAAIAQGWCGEYEEYRKRMLGLLEYNVPNDVYESFKDASDRRQKYTVTVTLRARNASAVYDELYAWQQAHDATWGDVVRADDSNSEDNDSDE